ncbi:leucyl aminopeptidase [Propionibacteriaceae bacterium G57]|uniref:leucyl aminopeptidase n=1 Tax=Aestuariimicrobium sp. G57 TaxID=3418485 RepID=UPI003DA7229F
MSRLSSFTSPVLTLVTAASKSTGIVVVGLATSGSDEPTLLGVPAAIAKAVPKRFGADVLELAEDLGATSELGKVTVLPSIDKVRLVVVGLGEVDVTPGQVRHAAATALRTIQGTEALDGPVAISFELADPELIQAAAEGAVLGAYTVETQATEARKALPEIELVSDNKTADAKAAIERATVITEAVGTARDWVNLPPNQLYPASFADEATAWLKDTKISIEVLDEKALAKAGYGGVLAVGGGSTRQPRLFRAEYAPKGATQTLALVGKGITFDSGGLDIKPAAGMYDMKCDMAGAAAVITTIGAIARLGLNVRVIAYGALAENMPSGGAYRPSDVLHMYGGLTVENANTDAEGRLVMADALARATQDNADLIVDIATLTGACVVALGKRIAGLMASDDISADAILDAAEVAGEPLWHLPIPDHIDQGLKSSIADVKSSGDRNGGALAAAAFLRRFTNGSDWAHIDIAGPAWGVDAPYAEVPVGGTGFGVRTLIALARTMSN